MQNKDKCDGIEDSSLDMLLVILLEGASKEVVMPSSSNPFDCAQALFLHASSLHSRVSSLSFTFVSLKHFLSLAVRFRLPFSFWLPFLL